MSRLRRLDRAILSEGTDTSPIDSEDQEQLIAQFVNSNDASLRLFLKSLAAFILMEIPISVLVLKRAARGPRFLALLLASHVLTLINCLYDFKRPSESTNDPNSGIGSYIISEGGPSGARHMLTRMLSFRGILLLNTVVLCQLLYLVHKSDGLKAVDILLILPVANLIAVALVRQWYRQMSSQIKNLHGLKYKFKTA